MNLPFFSKNKSSDNYFGLLLKEDQGIALIIEKKSGLTNIVDFEKFSYSSGWEHLTEDVDEVLFRLESKYKLHLEETIFFVFSHLIDEKTTQIKKPYQQIIKNLAKNLELKPLGFIDCREAITKLFEEKEEMRLTGIVIELDKNAVGIFIYKGGQLVFDKIVSRTTNLVDDLSLVFEQIKGKILLPARIILYNSADLDFEVTRILSFRWPDDLFIQLPKVEIVQEKEILGGLVDIFNQQIKIDKEEKVNPVPAKTKTGFVIGEDIGEKTDQQSPKQEKINLFSGPVQFFKNIHFTLPKLTLIKPDWQKKVFLGAGIVIIGLSLFFNEFYLHKAKVEVFVPSLNLEKKISLTVGEKGGVDLNIKAITQTDDVSTSKQAIGKKDVGDPAKGEVTIYNFSKEKTFSKGTKIETKGLIFIFDEEIKVASASLTSDGSAKLPGKGKVKNTASVIGDEGNLSKGQTFKIEDLDPDVYFARNESDFSDGSKKQITTVSKQDYQDLQQEVMKKAKDKKQISIKLSDDQKIINLLSKTEVIDTNYSKEVGEEAAQISLTAKVKTTIYVYQKSKLIDLLYPYLVKEVKSGFNLDKNKVNYQITKVTEKKAANLIDISASGKAIKTLDKNQVIKVLLGKNKNQIEKVLKNAFSITGYNLDLSQPLPLPFLNQALPFFPKNFDIRIDSL